jgi:hypothetical protein
VDTMHLRIFQTQVRDQCRFVLLATERVNETLKRVGDAAARGDNRAVAAANDVLWFELQNLLTAAANVSKVMWGSGGKLEEERRPLRESLGVPDDSPLKNTDLRNHFEHFDERIDRWWTESPNHAYIDRIIGPPNAISGTSVTDVDCFRQYNPATNQANFWGVDHDIQAIVSAAEALFESAAVESAKPNW